MHNNQQKVKTTVDVPPRFGSASRGDCILESVEGVKFKVSREILIHASEPMRDMFDLAYTPGPLPSIALLEDAETILNLLKLIYPASVLKNPGVQAAIKLAIALDKYLIPNDCLQEAVRPLYSSRSALKTSPIELYKLAWMLEMMAEARTASRYTHGIPDAKLRSTLAGEPLARLLDLRRRRDLGLDGLIAVVEPRKNLCPTHRPGTRGYFHQIGALKKKTRLSINVPYPEEDVNAFAFFGLFRGYPPAYTPSASQNDWPRNKANHCTCFEFCDRGIMSSSLAPALQYFPQCI